MDVLTTPPLPLADWLSVMEREYLSEFVPAGGAAVKFAILDDAAIDRAAEGLARLGRAHGMIAVPIEAERTRVHMMQELFFSISRALPWDGLVQRYLEGLFAAHGYAWPRPGETLAVAELARVGVAPRLLPHRVDQWLTRMCGRTAAGAGLPRRLAVAVPVAAGAGGRRNRRAGGAMAARREDGTRLAARCRHLGRLSRTNARAMLASLCHFLRKAGAAGLLVVLDMRRLSSTDRGCRGPAALLTGRGDGRLRSAAGNH